MEMTNYYGGGHHKPSVAEITAQLKKSGYEKHFICKYCKQQAITFISSKHQAGVSVCNECSDKYRSGSKKGEKRYENSNIIQWDRVA